MPHIDIKCYPKHLTQQELEAFRQALTDVVTHHLKATPSDLSIRYTEIPSEEWKSKVWDKEIHPQLNNLLKKPGYVM